MQSLREWVKLDGAEAKVLISLGFPGEPCAQEHLLLHLFATTSTKPTATLVLTPYMPAVFAALAANRGLSTISLSFVGQLGASELAAAGLATSLANVTGDSVLVGISSAMQTLCGQVMYLKMPPPPPPPLPLPLPLLL